MWRNICKTFLTYFHVSRYFIFFALANFRNELLLCRLCDREKWTWFINFSAWFTRLGNTKDLPLSILCEVSCSTSRTLGDSYFHITISFAKTKEIIMWNFGSCLSFIKFTFKMGTILFLFVSIYFQKGVLQPERHIFHLLKIIKYSRKIFSPPPPSNFPVLCLLLPEYSVKGK